MKNNYFLGLDIGTNSVGYAVTDAEYRIQKFRQKSMWGVNLFENINQASERRTHRCSRRRLERVKQRVNLIRELFAVEIGKKDPDFYKRLDESFLYIEDKETASPNSLFADACFTDKEYYNKYPTIHHLIMDLINDKTAHDVRLVYLAVSYLVSHRGHFLSDANKEDIDKILSFEEMYKQFLSYCDESSSFRLADYNAVSKAFTENKGINAAKTALTKAIFNNEKPSKQESEIIKALSGGEFKLSVLFDNELYSQLESDKLSFSKEDSDDKIEAMLSDIGDDADMLFSMKNLYDWSVVSRMMSGGKEKFISNVKIKQYEKHKNDLRLLKFFTKKYIPEKYNELFKTASSKLKNYAAYSKNYKSISKSDKEWKSANIVEFSEYVRKLFKDVKPDEKDKADFDRMISELNSCEFMPKQKNTDNRLIPYQLYWYELKHIIDNASEYLDFLCAKDNSGLSAGDKILSVFEFRIPYYVGPLSKYKNDNAWIVRKSEKIFPWNFDDVVDKDKSEEAFIRHMTNKCSYIAGEDVLPKNSLLYSKFMVLNIINKLKLDGAPVSVSLKQELYNDLFLKDKKKVTKKSINNWLVSKGIKVINIDGISDIIPITLKSHHIFRRMFWDKILSESDVERIIARATITTDKQRLKKWIKNEFRLSDEDIRYIANQNFSEYGNLSEKLLNEIEAPNPETGEMLTIIRALWETNYNLTELLSSQFGYADIITELNKNYYSENGHTISDMLNEMYIPNSVKRSVFRTIDIVKEISHIQKCEPKKIFIEVAKEHDNSGEKFSRKKQLLEKYKAVTEDVYRHMLTELNNEDDSRLKSKKIYLYYAQLGRCMYSGEPIDLERLIHDNQAYDIDHIYPQSRVKDDSLDNMVLVKKELNGQKSDTYPIDINIREKMSSFWHTLHSKKLISGEKLHRLTRGTTFNEEELSGFINRQIVETRQSTKAVARILQELCPNSEIVYVKAHLASDFRHTFGFEKCRDLNDLHHAKDAYLNIVMGNIYNVKFTKNPIHFLKESEKNKKYTIKLTDKKGQGLLSKDIQRYGETAWRADGTSIAVVNKMMHRNDINYVRYSFCRKGQLFNLTIEKAPHCDNDLVPIKKGLDTAKYGGYNNTTATYFTLVKHSYKNKDVISILPVDLLENNTFRSDEKSALEYLKTKYKLINPRFAGKRRIIKINTMIEFDNGFRANIASKSNGGKTLVLSSAASLIVGEKNEQSIRKILSKLNKVKQYGETLSVSEQFDKLTKEENLSLYDTFINKTKSNIYSSVFSKMGQLMIDGRNTFINLSIEDQIKALKGIIDLFKTGRTTGCDLTLIGGSKQSGIITISSKLNKHMRIVDQSPTGLYENKSSDLLNL